MATFIGVPGDDPTDIHRPHVPLELTVKWTATYAGSSSTPPLEDLESTNQDIPLKGGTGPSGVGLFALPTMAGIPVAVIGDPDTLDHVEVDAWDVTFYQVRHHIPCRIIWERTEIDADDNEVVTNGEIQLRHGPETRSFSASTPASLSQAFVCAVVFTIVYAPDLT